MRIGNKYDSKTIWCIIVFTCNLSFSFGQTGINTKTPAQPTEIITSAGKVVITEEGNLGIGVENPNLAIDLRKGTNGAMAIGMTDQTAADAGAGAIRYNPRPAIGVQGFIEFSDGEEWIGYHPYGKPRLVVMAEKTNNNVTVFETGAAPVGDYTNGIKNRSSTYLTYWTEKLDSDSGTSTNNFDPAKGEFIAPREGVYFATFTFALAENRVNGGGSPGNNQVEAIWEVRNPTNQIIQRIKTNNAYPSDTPAKTVIGSACTVSLYLNKGDKLRPFVWMNIDWGGEDRPLLNTGGYNVLTIVEQ